MVKPLYYLLSLSLILKNLFYSMKLKYIIIIAFIALIVSGWGSTGHRIINRKIVLSFPSQINFLQHWQDSLARHGSDADYRKSSDPTEGPRHYIDIDEYPEFVANGRIPQTLDSLINLHGYTFVYDNGILPFAIIAWTDSLRRYFQQGNWQAAMLKAADIGHYVGDAHNPLHITRNYDGQYTNQSGVHSRYETQLINRDSAYFTYGGEPVSYVSDLNNFVFGFIYANYPYVDSVLKADSISRALAGSYGELYYQYFWQLAGNFTIMLFKNSSKFTAQLIYTAWVNAGSPVFIKPSGEIASGFSLSQNYPNPFNSSTMIRFGIPSDSRVKLSVFDINGRELITLVEGYKPSGNYSVNFIGDKLPSGVYYYKLVSENFTGVKKMIMIK